LIDPIKIGMYILLFIPGFIFVQIKEHHLLREKIPQFEKTLDIILWSAIIWVVILSIPYLPFANYERNKIIDTITLLCKKSHLDEIPNSLLVYKENLIIVFLSTCLWTFIISNLYGLIRKWKWIDSIVKWFTGRDWYPSVAFKFYKENLNKAVEIKTSDNRYFGILYSAPDRKEDKSIIITNPFLITGAVKRKKLEQLQIVDYIIIKVDEIEEIKAYKPDILIK
jgi:hypothetical protein